MNCDVNGDHFDDHMKHPVVLIITPSKDGGAPYAELKVIVRMGFLVYLLQENLQRAPTVLKEREQYYISMCSISNIKHIYVT